METIWNEKKKISQKYYKNNWKTLQIIEESSQMTEKLSKMIENHQKLTENIQKLLEIWITIEKYQKWSNGLKNDEFWEKS